MSAIDYDALRKRLRERLPHLAHRHIQEIITEDDNIVTLSNEGWTTTALPEPVRYTSIAQLWFTSKSAMTKEECDDGMERIRRAREELDEIEEMMKKRRRHTPSEAAVRRKKAATERARSAQPRPSMKIPTPIDVKSLYECLQ